MTDRRVLNLDEMFGLARPIQVVWQERTYDLKTPEAFGPKDMQTLERLQARYQPLAAKMQRNEDALTEAEDKEIREIAAEEIRLLCPSLARLKLQFMQQFAVLAFYFQELELRRQADAAKKAEMTGSLPTGATSTSA